ncbi:MAG: cupin domain-containing protein [Myxococcales bacterium]
MADEKRPPFFVRAEDRKTLREESSSHPLNPQSEIRGWSLCDLTGLKRAGVFLIRIPSGKESFAYHLHRVQEEWFYALSGRAIAEVDGKEFQVGAGDFMGFAVPSLAHHLRNPFADDFVYLSGGERGPVEIADFPRLGKRIIFAGPERMLADIASFEALSRWGDDG